MGHQPAPGLEVLEQPSDHFAAGPQPVGDLLVGETQTPVALLLVQELGEPLVEATERLGPIRPAVSIFGSARVSPDSAYYLLTEIISRKLSDAGFAVISGGGPGVIREPMENYDAVVKSICLFRIFVFCT